MRYELGKLFIAIVVFSILFNFLVILYETVRKCIKLCKIIRNKVRMMKNVSKVIRIRID